MAPELTIFRKFKVGYKNSDVMGVIHSNFWPQYIRCSTRVRCCSRMEVVTHFSTDIIDVRCEPDSIVGLSFTSGTEFL